jgi:hypothetical protein
MDNEIEKATLQHIGEIVSMHLIRYSPKPWVKKPTGNISVVAFDAGAGITGKFIPLIPFS